MKNWLLFIILGSLFADNSHIVELPIGFTDDEMENLDIIKEMGRETDPPPTPIRNIAEFEPMQGVLIRYPFGISTSIIREMSEDVIVYCLVTTGSQNSAYNSMNSAGVDMDNVEFINGETDSYWTRDYGPWWVVDGNRDVSVVDFTYNRPRPNDNDAPFKMANQLNVPYFASDFVTAGGNYMTDGYGISASTSLIFEENSMSNSEIYSTMENYYGIHTYHVVDDPNNEYIDHIDCWGKYLSPHKVLIREVPNWHAQYNEIEAVADYFSNTLTIYGEPWEIYRVYTGSNEPYTNSLILNNKVFVPIMNTSYDDDALQVYRDALPGYEVLSFTGSWESTDALHCRAKGIPDLEMLQIFHNPINDYENPQEYYEVRAIIDDLTETGLIELKVFWWTDEFNESVEIEMEVCPQDIVDCYYAQIPAQNSDTVIKYYIQAIDGSGKIESLPIAGYFDFAVVGGSPIQQGDINQDGVINVTDIVIMINHIIGSSILTDYQQQFADMNADDTINILDAILVVNIIVGN